MYIASPKAVKAVLSPELTAPLLTSLAPGEDGRPASRAKRSLFEEAARGVSVQQAVFSVINIYVGLGLLSKPYAVAQGGWISFIALALLCLIANVTGKLIVRGFAKLPRGQQSYAHLGRKAFGPMGWWLVHAVVTLELCGAIVVLLIFVWKNALLLAPWYMVRAPLCRAE
jgi:solute carrier family 32 (vesicular inhibitory amino acid transporter)